MKQSKVHNITPRQEPEQRSGLTPLQEMDNFFSQMFRNPWFHPLSGEWPVFRSLGWRFDESIPAVDVVDRDKEFLVRVQLPGVEKDQLDISVTETSVTIEGQARKEEKQEQEHYYRAEISAGSFSRTVPLPGRIDPDAVEASYTDGILELVLPKQEETTRRKVSLS